MLWSMKDATWRSPKPTAFSLYDFYTGFYVFLYFQQFVDLGPFRNKVKGPILEFFEKTIFLDFFHF